MTYTELKAAIAEWAHRSNIPATTIDLFIDLAEAEFNVRLRCVEQETVAALACASKFTDLPADFLEMRIVEFNGSKLRNLSYATPELIADWRSREPTGDPLAYSIRGTSIELIPAPGSDDPSVDGFGDDLLPFVEGEVNLILTYWAEVPALSDANTSNWLLAAHPNMYLYECLRQLSVYTRDDSSVQRYAMLLQGYYQAMRSSDRSKRWGGVSMRVRVA